MSQNRYEEGVSIKTLYNGFKDEAKKANLPTSLRQHDPLHRRVTTRLAAGHPQVAVQHAMGHSDIKTTISYYQLLPEHLRALVGE